MNSGRVLYASHDNVHVLRFIGEIRYTLSPSIDNFLEGIFATTTPAGFVIDLGETDSIDSTNLGLLARLARRMQGLDAGRITVVSNRDEINSVLYSMALDEVFDIVPSTSLGADAEQEIPHQDADRETLSKTLIEAHRALMELSEHNRETFQDVVASLDKSHSGG